MADANRREEASDQHGERSSIGKDKYFNSVFLTYTIQRDYRVPAIRSRRVLEGPPSALFPLS